MRRATTSTPKHNKLSSLLTPSDPQDKICMVNKQISTIDILNPRFHNIRTIYLSQNFITDITNLGQFKQLRVLSLANNQVTTLTSLATLSALKHLEILNLMGNHVCKNLLYECWVLDSCCSTLKKLDNCDVKQGHMARMKEFKRKVDGKFDQLVVNYGTIVGIYNGMGLRIEEKGKESILQSLYEDCVEIYNHEDRGKEKEEGFLMAMDELIIKQGQKIEETQLMVEEESKEDQEDKEQGEASLQLFRNYEQSLKQDVTQSLCLMVGRIQLIALTTRYEALMAIKEYSTDIEAKSILLCTRLKHNLFVALRQQRVSFSSHQQSRSDSYELRKLKLLKQKQQERQLKQSYLFLWKQEYTHRQIQHQSQQLYITLTQFKDKEKKYIHKIQLLESILQINRNKLKSCDIDSSVIFNQKHQHKENTPSQYQQLTGSRIRRQSLTRTDKVQDCESIVRRRRDRL